MIGGRVGRRFQAGLAAVAAFAAVGCSAPAPAAGHESGHVAASTSATTECARTAHGAFGAEFGVPCTVAMSTGSFRVTVQRPVRLAGYPESAVRRAPQVAVYRIGLPVRIDHVTGSVPVTVADFDVFPNSGGSGKQYFYHSTVSQSVLDADPVAYLACKGQPPSHIPPVTSIVSDPTPLTTGQELSACLPIAVTRRDLPQGVSLAFADPATGGRDLIAVSWPDLVLPQPVSVPLTAVVTASVSNGTADLTLTGNDATGNRDQRSEVITGHWSRTMPLGPNAVDVRVSSPVGAVTCSVTIAGVPVATQQSYGAPGAVRCLDRSMQDWQPLVSVPDQLMGR